MKALNCKLSVILLLIAVGSTSLFAKEVKKTQHEEFKTNGSTVLSVETKFSELTVESWNKNLASFDVTIIADHDNEEKAMKMLELMTVKFKQDGNKLSVETKIEDKFGKTEWGKTNKFKFVIVAKVPADINLELENNLGSVEITDLTGHVSVENNYGSFAANSLTGKTELELNYGTVIITELADAEVELNYGDLTITESQNLSIEVNFGTCKIKKAVDVSAEVNMGNLEIEEVSAQFKLLEIEANTSDVEIGINKAAGFKLSAEVNMGSLDLPNLDQMEKNKNGMNKVVRGSYGHGHSVVDLEGNMGSITIELK